MFKYSTTDLQSDGTYNIDCTSTAHPKLNCFLTVVSPATVAAIATTYDTLKINGFSSTIARGSTLVITTSNTRFRNPPSTKPITTITSASYNVANL